MSDFNSKARMIEEDWFTSGYNQPGLLVFSKSFFQVSTVYYYSEAKDGKY